MPLPSLATLKAAAQAAMNPAATVGVVRCPLANMGDIMLDQAIQRLLDVRLLTLAKTHKTQAAEAIVGLRRFCRYSGIGGGTLIFAPPPTPWLEDAEFLAEAVEPLFVFGTGVIDPEFFNTAVNRHGDKREITPEVKQRWIRCLRKFPNIGVRGENSKRLLESEGLESPDVIGDPALAFARDTIAEKPRQKNVGLNLSSYSYFWGNSAERCNIEMMAAITSLLKKGWNITLFPAMKEDLTLSRTVVKELGDSRVKIFNAFDQPERFVAGVAAQDVFVGVKLHSVIAAFCSYTPAIMIGYQPKAQDFMTTMGADDGLFRTDQVAASDVVDAVEARYEESGVYRERMFNVVQEYRKRLVRFSEKIQARISG